MKKNPNIKNNETLPTHDGNDKKLVTNYKNKEQINEFKKKEKQKTNIKSK